MPVTTYKKRKYQMPASMKPDNMIEVLPEFFPTPEEDKKYWDKLFGLMETRFKAFTGKKCERCGNWLYPNPWYGHVRIVFTCRNSVCAVSDSPQGMLTEDGYLRSNFPEVNHKTEVNMDPKKP